MCAKHMHKGCCTNGVFTIQLKCLQIMEPITQTECLCCNYEANEACVLAPDNRAIIQMNPTRMHAITCHGFRQFQVWSLHTTWQSPRSGPGTALHSPRSLVAALHYTAQICLPHRTAQPQVWSLHSVAQPQDWSLHSTAQPQLWYHPVHRPLPLHFCLHSCNACKPPLHQPHHSPISFASGSCTLVSPYTVFVMAPPIPSSWRHSS